MVQPLEGLRVLELGVFVSAPYCGKLFAGYGADVIKVEPPGGDIARAHGPFPGGEPHSEKSALFMYLNTGKRSVVLDPRTPAGREAILQLVAQSDVVIENFHPGDARSLGISYDDLKQANPKAVVVSITPFGQDGPYAEYRGNNLISFAVGGQMYITGTQEDGPLKNGGYQADYQGGLNGFSAAMLGVLAQERDNAGQHIDVSVMQCMAPILEAGIPYYSYLGQWFGFRRGNRMASFIGIYPCIDGHVGIHAMARNWKPLTVAMGRPDLATDERYATQAARGQHNDELTAEFYGWAAGVTKKEAYAAAGPARAPLSFVHTTTDILDSPQYQARGFLTKVEHPVAGEGTYLGPPWWIGPDGWSTRPAPLLGADTAAVLRDVAGMSESEIARATA